MNIRSAISVVFFATGFLFFILAARNFMYLEPSEGNISLDEFTSSRGQIVDVSGITSQRILPGTSFDPAEVDILSLIFLPANYECGVCSHRAHQYIDAFQNHAAFENLSTMSYIVLMERSMRTATHFARVNQFEVPAFQLPKAFDISDARIDSDCFVLFVEPHEQQAFFKVDVSKVRLTEVSDQIFEEARMLYQRRFL